MQKDVKSTLAKHNRLHRRLFGAFLLAVFAPVGFMSVLVAAFYLQVFRETASDILLNNLTQILAEGVVLLAAILLTVWAAYRLSKNIAKPVADTATALRQAGEGDLQIELPISNRSDEIGELTKNFNEMCFELQSQMEQLVEQAADDRLALEKNNKTLLLFADVSRAVSASLDPEELGNNLVELVHKKFDFSFAGLYIADEDKKWAALSAAAGSMSEDLLTRGHRLAISDDSLIGWVITNSQNRVASIHNEEQIQGTGLEKPVPISEAVVPMRSRGSVIGALEIQSSQPQAFNTNSMAILQVLADQTAVAIDNARLFAENRQALENATLAYREISHTGWLKLLNNPMGIAFEGTSIGVDPVSPSMQAYVSQSIEGVHPTADSQPDSEGLYPLAVPIRAGEAVLGTLNTYKPVDVGPWTADEFQLLSNIADQLGLALESSRLFEESQRRTEYEKITGQVNAKIRERLEIEAVLRTAAQEVRRAMGLPEVTVRLTAPNAKNDGVSRS